MTAQQSPEPQRDVHAWCSGRPADPRDMPIPVDFNGTPVQRCRVCGLVVRKHERATDATTQAR